MKEGLIGEATGLHRIENGRGFAQSASKAVCITCLQLRGESMSAGLDIAKTGALPVSLMPAGLDNILPQAELRKSGE